MDVFGPFHTNPGLFLTVPKQSKWAIRGQPTYPSIVPLFETDFHVHFRPHTHQHTICCTISNTNTKNSPYTATDYPNGSQKFPHFGSKICDRSNGHSRPQTYTSITKHLNKGKTSRIKPLPHGVCQNSSKSVPTRCPRSVEQLSLLLRRNLTVQSSEILERSCTLSL